MRLDFTNKLKQTQYAAALAATGAWEGSSREKLYKEFGWETLYDRRCFRRLCHVLNNLHPICLLRYNLSGLCYTTRDTRAHVPKVQPELHAFKNVLLRCII